MAAPSWLMDVTNDSKLNLGDRPWLGKKYGMKPGMQGPGAASTEATPQGEVML